MQRRDVHRSLGTRRHKAILAAILERVVSMYARVNRNLTAEVIDAFESLVLLQNGQRRNTVLVLWGRKRGRHRTPARVDSAQLLSHFAGY